MGRASWREGVRLLGVQGSFEVRFVVARELAPTAGSQRSLGVRFGVARDLAQAVGAMRSSHEPEVRRELLMSSLNPGAASHLVAPLGGMARAVALKSSPFDRLWPTRTPVRPLVVPL